MTRRGSSAEKPPYGADAYTCADAYTYACTYTCAYDAASTSDSVCSRSGGPGRA